MLKRYVPALSALCLVALLPAPAAAQQTFNFSLGLFTPRGEDARVDGDVITANRDFLFYDVGDFKSASIGAEWLVPLGNWVEAGAGIAFSRRTVDSVYTDWLDDLGNEVQQELRLRLVPLSFTVRALPLGQANALQPYIGVGLAVINWRYAESGDFIDFSTPDLEIFRASYVADGTATAPVILGGVRFGGETLSAGGEIRYHKAEADLPDDLGFYVRPERALQGLGPRLDLGGWTYNFTIGVRFGR